MPAIDNDLKVVALFYVEARVVIIHHKAVVEFRQVDGAVCREAPLSQLTALLHGLDSCQHILQEGVQDGLLKLWIVQHVPVEVLVQRVSCIPRREVQVLGQVLQVLTGVLYKLRTVLLRLFLVGVVIVAVGTRCEYTCAAYEGGGKHPIHNLFHFTCVLS